MSRETLLKHVAELVQTKLKPLVEDIDRKGLYPEAFLRELGWDRRFLPPQAARKRAAARLGLAVQIEVLREVGKACGATAFSAWCQAPAPGICTKRRTRK